MVGDGTACDVTKLDNLMAKNNVSKSHKHYQFWSSAASNLKECTEAELI